MKRCCCLVVVVLAIVTALAPMSTPSAIAQVTFPVPKPLKVVQIGDSYSAGNGAGSYYGPRSCYRSRENWAERYVAAIRAASGFQVTFVNRACSGAVSDNILNDRDMGTDVGIHFASGSYSSDTDRALRREILDGPCKSNYADEERFEIVSLRQTSTLEWFYECRRTLTAQIRAVGRDTDLVVFTIGGNDIRFAKIIEQCFALGFRDPGDCRSNVNDARALLPEMTSRTENILAQLRSRMRPDARVILSGYPYLERSDDYTLRSLRDRLPFVGGDTYRAGLEIRLLGRQGDDAQRLAVTNANSVAGAEFAFYVDGVKARFAGHEPDGSVTNRNPDRWIHEFDSTTMAEWYHPNNRGHQEWGALLSERGAFGAAGRPNSSNIDVVFVIDTTGSMGSSIASVKVAAATIVGLLSVFTTSFRFALVDYRDFPSRTGSSGDYASRLQLPFTDNPTSIVNAINALDLGYGGDFPETAWSGLKTAIDQPWRPGVKKAIILLGDAPALDPEPISGLTANDVVAGALAVDPAEIYVVDVSGARRTGNIRDVATRSGGSAVDATGAAAADAMLSVLRTAIAKPYAWLNGPYVTNVGASVTLDASGSYDGDGAIVRYDWDLDGNGTYDQSTTGPTIVTQYVVPIDGIAAVRVTDNAGLSTVATTRLSVSVDGDEVPDGRDNCPTIANAGQTDFDTDGVGDECDPTPGWPTADKPGVTDRDPSAVSIVGEAPNSVDVHGSGHRVTGLLTTNGGVDVVGSGHAFTGGVQYASSIRVRGNGTVIDPAAVQIANPTPPVTVSVASLRPGSPAAVGLAGKYHAIAESQCDGGTWRPSGVVDEGVYYSTCAIHLNGVNTTRGVTFVSERTIEISGPAVTLRGYGGGIALLAGAPTDSAISVAGTGHVFDGAVMAPAGGVRINANGMTTRCGVTAQSLVVAGSGNVFTRSADC